MISVKDSKPGAKPHVESKDPGPAPLDYSKLKDRELLELIARKVGV